MLIISGEQVKFRVFLYFNAQIIQSCDGCVACEEVLRTRTERYYLQVFQTDNSSCYGDKLMYHVSYFGCSADGIFWNVSLNASQLEVVACIEHTAVSIASVINQCIAAVVLSGGYEHSGTVEVLSQQSFGCFGTEVAQINDQCVTASGIYFIKCLTHVLLVLDNGGTYEQTLSAIFCGISLSNGISSVFGQAHGETVP